MLAEHDLVLAMSPWHVAEIHRLYGAPKEESVPDPYGGPYTAYRASVRLLLEHMNSLMKRLGPR